jgi:5-(carboxyamino)imidazole ribonucleotide synthase
MSKNTLGIIGGGQLGMFICMAAKKIGVKTIVYSDSEDFSAKKFCDNFFIGGFDDKKIIQKFIDSAEFFTIETENIPKEILRFIQKKKKLFPSSKIIEISQNRIKEKKFINSIEGIKTPRYCLIKNFDDLKEAIEKFGCKCILKSQEFGYDGKWQYLVDKKNINTLKKINLNNFVLEELVDFKLEISVIVISNRTRTICYPPVENLHKKSILRETIFPARINKSVSLEAKKKAKKIARKLQLNGVLAVEMFVMKDHKILINELAPRPHNSGHWSIDSCKYSQFDNLVSSIVKNTLREPLPQRKCRMVNIIGNEYSKFDQLKKKYKCYDYYKKGAKPQRKMGHYIVFV